MKTAIILGATGLTGTELLKQLLNDDHYQKIILFSRKSTNETLYLPKRSQKQSTHG